MRHICSLIPRWQKILLFLGLIELVAVQLYDSYEDEVLRPERPEFQIDSAALTQLDVTAGLSPPELTATLNLTVLVINPNVKLGLDFYSIEAMLFLKMINDDGRERVLLAAKPVSPYFFMPTMTNTTVSFDLSTTANTFIDPAKPISEAKARGGSARFEIRMSAWWNYRSVWYNLGGLSRSKVNCGLLEFAFDDQITKTWNLTVNSRKACEHARNDFSYY